MGPSDSATVAPLTRRTLIVRDSLILLSLALFALVLFGITLFLFRSFNARRAALARRWLDRGRLALTHARPTEAVDALRVTLDYAPDDAESKFLLAEALEQSGHADEATSYLNELSDERPGSGRINLERARIAARRGERLQAVESYRAAVYGTWEGDGVVRRQEIRLELARYLLAQQDKEAARAELLIAGGNTAGDADADLAIARLMEQADDPSDAYRLDLRAAASPPYRASALFAAGQIDFRRDDFVSAQHLFLEAQAALPQRHSSDAALQQQLADRLQLLNEVLGLTLSPGLSNTERVTRILRARNIAQRQISLCEGNEQRATEVIADMAARWSAPGARTDRATLLRDRDRQRAAINLNEQTAELASRACTASQDKLSVDDQALLVIARADQKAGH